jgi:hypothetical protein
MPHLKNVNASQGYVQNYEDLKRELYSCSANIYFNQKCLRNNLIPNYGRIKIPNNSPASKYTQNIFYVIKVVLDSQVTYTVSKYWKHNGDALPEKL